MRSPAAAFALLLALPALAAGVGTAELFIPPPAEFPEVTGESGIRFTAHKWTPELGPPGSLLDLLPPGAPAVGDYNLDGFPDLFFPSPQYTDEALNAARAPRSMLWANDGSTVFRARFMDVTDASGLGLRGFAYAAAWGDADGDGWPDLFVGGYRLAKLFRSLGDGGFEDVTAAWGLPQDGLVTAAAWQDYDRDGDLDLALGHFSSWAEGEGLVRPAEAPGRANQLLRNDGGSFTDVTAAAGLDGVARRTTALAWVDADHDGRPDLHAANLGQPGELWRNLGDGTFGERAGAMGLDAAGQSPCAGWGDVDGDGRDDAFLPGAAGEAPALLLATGPATYAERAAAWDLGPGDADAWGCVLFDYDQDGDLDAAVVRSGLEGDMARQPLLLMNQRYHAEASAPVFSDATAEAGDGDLQRSNQGNLSRPGAFTGLAAIDYNLDGAPDLVAVPTDGTPAKLFGNMGHFVWITGNWVKVYLQGAPGSGPALGARVTVTAGDLTGSRTLGGAGGDGGDGPAPMDFGLLRDIEGNYRGQPFPVSVRVEWPSGHVDTWDHAFRSKNQVVLFEGGGHRNDTQAPDVRPVLSGTAGARGWFTSEEVRVTWSIRDRAPGSTVASGLRSATCSVGLGPWGPCVPVTLRGDGIHVLRAIAEDHAGNRAFYTPTVFIDSTAPGAGVADPPPRSASAQGRSVLAAPPLPFEFPGYPPAPALPAPPRPLPPVEAPWPPPEAPHDAALVLAPARFDARHLGAAGEALTQHLGSDGTQVVAARAEDATSGVHRVTFRVANASGGIVAERTLFLGPWTWAWPADRAGAGEHTLEVEVEDAAGWVRQGQRRVFVVPTGPQGLEATLAAGPPPLPVAPPAAPV